MESVCMMCIAKDFTLPERPRRITQNTLVNAAAKGHDKCVQALIQLGARVNRLDEKRNSPLMKAVEKGYETCTNLLLKAGADVNLAEYSGGSAALHKAAAKGQWKCLEKLIEAGADVNLAGTGGLTALHMAVEYDQEECFKMLIELGADVNLSGANGCTALHKAAENKSKKYLEKLIENKANVHAVDANGQTSLLKAASRDGNKTGNKETKTGTPSSQCIEILLKAGADVNIVDHNGHTPLSRAAECGDQKAMEILLQNGANIDATDSSGNTPLIKTVQRKYVNCLIYLVNQGADVNIANKHGMTPLIAASGICPSVVVLLVDKGAKVNVKTSSGKTPLSFLAYNVSDEEFELGKVCLDLLISAGADVNLLDSESGTPLMSAIKYDHEKTFTYLLEKGADTNKVSGDNGCAALHYAAQFCRLDYIQCLALHAADVNMTNNKEETPLIIAASNPKFDNTRRTINCIKLLLKMGAVVNHFSNRGITATGGLLTQHRIYTEDKYEALKLLYVAGEAHESIIVDCNEKLIVLQHFYRHNGRVDPGIIRLAEIYSGLFGNRMHILPLHTTAIPPQFIHDPNNQLDISLLNFCRIAVRKHLLHVNRNKNLFGLVPKLPLASLINDYLLYGVSLDF